MLEKNRKVQNGITLIALVITIIVLLILAGVTINLTLGENGLIKRTQESANAHKEGAKNDSAFMNNSYEYIEQYFNENTHNTEDNPETPPIIPGDSSNLTGEEKDILTDNGITEMKPTEITNSNLIDNDNIKAVITGEVPIPIGFSYLDGTKETGVVIKNDTDNNEFVWVPTEGLGYTYNRYAFSRSGWVDGQTMKSLDATTNSYNIIVTQFDGYYFREAMPTDEKESIDKYKGYFIGRYEAGRPISSTSTKPISQPGKTAYTSVSKDQAHSLSSSVYNKEIDGVKTKLCSSYVWDTALKFIETNHPGWGANSSGENYSSSVKNTGYHSVNNIFDMGGNVSEFITESFSNSAQFPWVIRGGSWNSSGKTEPAGRRWWGSSSVINGYHGFRFSLFL